ncbi:unnamed protein product [Arabidopsis lyrata]|nr:unnamed protein product [Arabidopsis lyrata]
MAESKRKRSRAASKIEDPIQLFTNQMQQQTIAIYGFPLGLQLLAYRNISGLLDKIPGSSDDRTFLEWHSIGIPKNNLSLNEVHLLERDPDLIVTPLLFVDHNEEGWGDWDDEVRDKKVLYLIEQIRKCHEFTKKEWPGGYADLELISVNEKERVVEHKKHIVNRKRKHTATPSSKGTQSKSKVGTTRRGRKRKFDLVDDDEADDIKLWVNSQLDAIRREFAESVKKLRAQNVNLLKKIKALTSLKMPKFQYHKFSRSRQSSCPPSRKIHKAGKHPILSESPVKAAVDAQNIRTPPSSPLTSMHEEDNSASGEPAMLVDDMTWRRITSQQCGRNSGNTNMDSVTSPRKSLKESPSRYLSADSTEAPQSDQPIYDTESKLTDEPLSSPQLAAVYDTTKKPSSIDGSEEINIGDLVYADNVDTLVQSVCKSTSPTIAAADVDSLPSQEEFLAVDYSKIIPQDDQPDANISDDIVSNSDKLQNSEITPQDDLPDGIKSGGIETNFVLVIHSEIETTSIYPPKIDPPVLQDSLNVSIQGPVSPVTKMAADTQQDKDVDIENDDDEDSAVKSGDVVDVSDSSPARERKPTTLSDKEAKLVELVLNLPRNSPTKQYDLLPRLDKTFFKVFMDILRKAPHT